VDSAEVGLERETQQACAASVFEGGHVGGEGQRGTDGLCHHTGALHLFGIRVPVFGTFVEVSHSTFFHPIFSIFDFILSSLFLSDTWFSKYPQSKHKYVVQLNVLP